MQEQISTFIYKTSCFQDWRIKLQLLSNLTVINKEPWSLRPFLWEPFPSIPHGRQILDSKGFPLVYFLNRMGNITSFQLQPFT